MGSNISSNTSTAAQRATALFGALDSLQSGSIQTDGQTTVQGNQEAQAKIARAKATSGQVSVAVANAARNIQSVAKEFEAVDQAVRQAIHQQFGGGL